MAPATKSDATVDGMVASLATQPPVDLTYEQAVAAAMLAGFTDTEAATMAAISTVETSRNCLAVSGKTAGGIRSWGAFAVRMTDGQSTDGGWMSPVNNAAQALTQARFQGMASWPSYASGLHVAALPNARLAQTAVTMKVLGQPPAARPQVLRQIAQPDEVVAQIAGLALQWQLGSVVGPAVGTGADTVGQLGASTGTATAETVGALTKPFTSVLDFLNALGRPGTWVRIALAAVGGALIVVALRQVATQ